MYTVLVSELPTDSEGFWKGIDDAFYTMRLDFETLHFETPEEAVDRVYEDTYDPNTLRFDSVRVVRFRRSDDFENLFGFFNSGKSLCVELAPQIKSRFFTPELFLKWGILCFYHGFVMNSAFATGSEVGAGRAAIGGREAVEKKDKKKWVATHLQRLLLEGRDRDRAERDVAAHIRDLRASKDCSYKDDWLKDLLAKDGQLKRTYRKDRLEEEEFASYIDDDSVIIPPVKENLRRT